MTCFRPALFAFVMALVVCCAHGGENTVVVADNLPYEINCDAPYVCQWDPKPDAHCVTSGRVVFGHCGLQIAICM
ncbi:hypothetical protein BaRGS_00005450 [Batillaria attramentaria]|uniref:Uncharacterized protein n=1 Tax=Batillaria attramentaria TaxID=370345 RepID=A0ABD0LUG9_9CAEN